MSQELRLEKNKKEQIFRGLEFSCSLFLLSYIYLAYYEEVGIQREFRYGWSLPLRKSQMLVSICHLIGMSKASLEGENHRMVRLEKIPDHGTGLWEW